MFLNLRILRLRKVSQNLLQEVLESGKPQSEQPEEHSAERTVPEAAEEEHQSGAEVRLLIRAVESSKMDEKSILDFSSILLCS